MLTLSNHHLRFFFFDFTVQNDSCYDKEREKIHKYCRSAIVTAALLMHHIVISPQEVSCIR